MVNIHMFNRKAKTAPSHYPRILFHGLRTFQLLASLVVGGIMCYFIYHLTHDRTTHNTPWTFIWLTAASLLSIASLAVTIVMHCCYGLRPNFNLAVNGVQAVLWTISWSLLTWFMSGTLANVCDVEHWKEEVGIMVCRIYKALFTFTLLGFVSTIAALGLDMYVRRQQTRRGVYRLHDMNGKESVPAGTRGPFTDAAESERRESGAWDASRTSMGPYGEQSNSKDQQQGYAVPENQFDYDTAYDGRQSNMH